MDLFVSVPAGALGCYLVLLLVFLLSKHSRLKWAFVEIMLAYVFWALGSMCMRFGWYPSIKFWFYFSLFGLFWLPVAILRFTLVYIDEKFSWKYSLLSVGTLALFLVNLLTDGIFIDVPERVRTGSDMQFVYHNSALSVIPYLYMGMALGCIFCILIRAVRKNLLTRTEFLLLFLGKSLLLLGNILINSKTFSGFPIDMFCGILDALLLAAVLCFSGRFKQTMYVSRTTYRVLVMMAISLLLICMEVPYEQFLLRHDSLPFIKDLLPGITTLTFLILNIVFFWITELVTDKVFLKDKEVRIKALDAFNLESCQTLDIRNIQKLVQEAAKELLGADWAVLYIKSRDQKSFAAEENSNAAWALDADNCLVRHLHSGRKWLNVSEAVRGADPEGEFYGQLRLLQDKQVGCILPIFVDNDVAAILFVSARKRNYHSDEMSYLESLAASASVSITNAELYAAAYWEARTDELTGMGNRKYFYEFMGELVPQETASLIIGKLDDFRIYNQLYGSVGGDGILKKVAAAIKNMVPQGIPVFRYGATEFSIVLKGWDSEEAFRLAEDIRQAVMGIISGIEKHQMMVTISCGVCTAEHGVRPDISMLDQCDMALYLAKKRGKNCTVVYHNDIVEAADNVVHIKQDIFSEYEPVFRALTAAIDAKDHYTFDHSQNVSYYAMELARACGLSDENIEIVKEAGLLHDIGKIGIPENILFKPGRLTEQEYDIMKGHVEQSIAILRHLSGMEYVLPAILGHHERYDGSGYPRGIRGEQISVLARILCIADSFDAMMSRRSYKTSYTLEHAVSELTGGAGTQFDPKLSALFVELLQSRRLQLRNCTESVS